MMRRTWSGALMAISVAAQSRKKGGLRLHWLTLIILQAMSVSEGSRRAGAVLTLGPEPRLPSGGTETRR